MYTQLGCAFLIGFGFGFWLCSLGVTVQLTHEEKMALIAKWRTELEDRDRLAEAARRRARE